MQIPLNTDSVKKLQDNHVAKISIQTKDKVEAAKNFIESKTNFFPVIKIVFKEKYSMMKKEEMENQINWELLKQKMDEMNLPDQEKDIIKKDILHKDAEKLRSKFF